MIVERQDGSRWSPQPNTSLDVLVEAIEKLDARSGQEYYTKSLDKALFLSGYLQGYGWRITRRPGWKANV